MCIRDSSYTAEILATGQIRLPDGRTFATLSRAAKVAADVPAYDGWEAWHLSDGRSMKEVRDTFILMSSPGSSDS